MSPSRTRPLPLLAAILLVACGAKTGLLIPDADTDPDATVDMPDMAMPPDMPAPVDMPPDLPRVDGCMDVPFELAPRPAEVLFTLDRSTSMQLDLNGETPADPADSRWQVLGDVLGDTLRGERLITPGAKFFPEEIEPAPDIGPDEVCAVSTTVEVPPATGALFRILTVFESTEPFGGTPTVDALSVAADFLRDRRTPGVPQFLVLATDGGPNCNPPPGPLGACDCAGTPESCLDPVFGKVNCLDDERAVRVIGEIADSGIPVFVVGFDDPMRPDLAAILDAMAVAGGRPRPPAASRRFYDVRDRDDLENALGEITGSVARCTLVTDFRPDADRFVSIRVDGMPIPEDPEDGWQWVDRDAGEVELVGEACRLATESDDLVVEGIQTCFDIAP